MNCPNQATPTCPKQPPNFASDIEPIFQAVCVGCHGPGGVEANRPLTTFDEITTPRNKITAFTQVLGCAMPPASAPRRLTQDERQTLIAWFACGTPGAETPDGEAPDGGAQETGAADGGSPDI